MKKILMWLLLISTLTMGVELKVLEDSVSSIYDYVENDELLMSIIKLHTDDRDKETRLEDDKKYFENNFKNIPKESKIKLILDRSGDDIHLTTIVLAGHKDFKEGYTIQGVTMYDEHRNIIIPDISKVSDTQIREFSKMINDDIKTINHISKRLERAKAQAITLL